MRNRWFFYNMKSSTRYLWILSFCAIGMSIGLVNRFLTSPLVQKGINKTQSSESRQIDFYQPTRDRQDIIDLFYRNLDWLTTNRDYSAEFMLDTHSPNDYESRYFGKFNIKVLRHDNAFVGFVGYYMKNFYEGTVVFLAIHEDFRGKHYGELLLRDAIDELKKQGASVITLLTWLHNKRSRALYERVGFVETSRSDTIIYYRYQD